MTRQRLDTMQAAQVLGISPDAVRKRVSRGQLDSEKTPDGKLYIWLDTDTLHADRHELVEELRDRIRFLEEELESRKEEARRKDHLLAAALERVPPQLESPSEPSESPRTAAGGEGGSGGAAPSDTEHPRPSWLRRFFGFE